MKRLFVASGLALAALSLPATAAVADGYEHRHVSKPKPKNALKRKAPLAKKHHQAKPAYGREGVRDFGSIYCCQRSHASYSLEQFESVETSYYEESAHHRVGPVVSYSERYVNPERGCHAEAPCGYSTGPQPAAHFFYGGHPGGVGYGVDGGPVYSGQPMFVVPGGGYYSSHAHGAASAASAAYGSSHSYYGGYGYGHAGAAYPPVYGHPGYAVPGAHGPHKFGKPHHYHGGKGPRR